MLSYDCQGMGAGLSYHQTEFSFDDNGKFVMGALNKGPGWFSLWWSME